MVVEPGRFADLARPGWDGERAQLIRALRALRALPAARTLDVACGTGFLTRHLPGDAVGLDQSEDLTADGLAQELGGVPFLDGRWFVGARAPLPALDDAAPGDTGTASG